MLLEDYRNERLKKLEALKEQGIDPYPSKSNRNTKISEVINHFDEKKGQEVCVAGRIVAIRSFGKLVFLKLRDVSGEVQIFMKATSDATPAGLLGAREVKLLDTGDFVEAKGIVNKSQTGEISVFADFVRLLTKTLRPLPEKFTNKEERCDK